MFSNRRSKGTVRLGLRLTKKRQISPCDLHHCTKNMGFVTIKLKAFSGLTSQIAYKAGSEVKTNHDLSM